MNIVTGADDNFAMPMAVTLYSALANMERGRAVSIYIMDGGISDLKKHKVEEVLDVEHVKAHIEWLKLDLVRLEGLFLAAWLKPAAYLRLFIPELLPAECERAIYLDSDLIIEKDLGQLWELNIDDVPALGAPNYFSPLVKDKKEEFQIAQVFGLAPETNFCNTGVLVMNLSRWRAEHLGRKALELAREYPLPESDQDAINIVVAGRWGMLDPKWNVQLSAVMEFGMYLKRSLKLSDEEMQQRCDDLLSDPYIIHYTGWLKPWFEACRDPLRSRFFHYLRESRWFGDGLDGKQLMTLTWNQQQQNVKWLKELNAARQALGALIPPGERFILVDDLTFHRGAMADWNTVRFLERDGEYCGPPPSDTEAIVEFERLRQSGANFIVFAWPAFWWLEYYRELHAYLQDHFPCVLQDEHLVVFDLVVFLSSFLSEL